MKNEKENKLAEEWITPSVNVMDVNKDTKNGSGYIIDDYVFYS